MNPDWFSEERYYIVGHPELSADDVNARVRNHWGIENRLHWILDMTFDEDASRIRTGHAAENFATVRHAALNLLRTAPGKKRGVQLRRMRCAWDRDYLLTVLGVRDDV